MLKKLVQIVLCGVMIATLAISIHPPVSVAQDDSVVWAAWDAKDVAAIGDDNSGSSVAVTDAVTTPAGAPSLEVTPSGTSEETKIAVPFTGADLADFATYSTLSIEVYLPEGNTVNPNSFFLGMADVGGEWTWVGGIFGTAESLTTGWNTVVYPLDPAMRAPVADHSYMLYFSFFSADEAGTKTPMVEPIYVGSATLSGTEAAAGGGEGEGTTAGSAEGSLAWAAWDAKDVATITDDNSGSTVAISEDVQTPVGTPSLQVTPSGTSEETKVAIPFTGADLADWSDYDQVVIEVYLPEGNTLNPNNFFMGMADVGGEWTWVGGIFGEATELTTGWNSIVYKPDNAMRAPVADHSYMLYLSFFSADEAGNKTVLTEPFYLGGAMLVSSAAVSPPAPERILWTAWETKNPGMIGHDNTGSSFAEGKDILTATGISSLQIIPSGTTEETKMAFPVSGANLQTWSLGRVELEIYLPPTNTVNPNAVFMGMADITGEWAWVGGVWGVFEGDTEWAKVIFDLDPNMRKPNPNGAYFIYFAFMYTDENGNKTVLTEPFYLGSMYAMPVPGEADQTLTWAPWESKDIAMLGDDNSGSTFAVSNDVLTPDGAPSLQIMPSGESAETKLAFPITAEDLADWATYTQVELDVYLPEGNAINPNKFFMGMGDTTGEWAWVGGMFGGALQLTTGWNRIVYVPLQPMRNPKEGGTYELYLSFFFEDASGKVPLTEPIYLGGAYLSAPEKVAAPGEYSQESVYQSEVDLLLSFDDVALLDSVGSETFSFFWEQANPANGLVKDRNTADSPASIASVGFALAGIPIAVDRGWINYNQGYERALVTLQTFANGGVQGDHGFFYHFVDMETGERVWSSEISSIDSALFIAGALTAGAYFKDTEVAALAQQLYENMDWEWMMAGGNMVSMGWKPDIGFLSATWDHFDESLLLYILGIGSPTHPIPAESWANWDRPVNLQGEFIYLGAEPLFVYQYPLAFFDLRGKEDAYANYFNNTTRACERSIQFAADNADAYATYQGGIWGISASDGPRGYKAYGATGGNHDGTIAPYASIACLPFTPEASMEAIRAMLTKWGTKVWREHGFVSAVNDVDQWYSVDHIGIDQGDILLMIANYQDGFVWNLLSQNPNVQNALNAMGFVESTGDYAVTPAYLEAFKNGTN